MSLKAIQNGGAVKIRAVHRSAARYRVVAGAGGGTSGATELDGLTDVTLTSPQSGDVLGYNGSAWVNTTTSAVDNDSRFLGLVGL